MSKFIEIHQDGDPKLININCITWIEKECENRGGVIHLMSIASHKDCLDEIALASDETYDELCKLLSQCK